MKELLTNSAFFGAFVSLGAYEIGVWIKKRHKDAAESFFDNHKDDNSTILTIIKLKE